MSILSPNLAPRLNRFSRSGWTTLCAEAVRSQKRDLQQDHRNRLSTFWTPTQRQQTQSEGLQNGSDLLTRAGFMRQAHSGVFHLLPLGLRVQDKVERLIDKHMRNLGACKASLSSISSEQLWQRSGRLDKGRGSEFLRFEDRKGAKYLLSPTHEEEITTIIADAAHSYKDLPLRLYQVSRKYRDELRPRQGLLRAREFVMKDLYTFDTSEYAAQKTYNEVWITYKNIFDDLKLPYLVAWANSGNMGGTLSHEFHFVSDHGEDTLLNCDNCPYVANEEEHVARGPLESILDSKQISSAVFLSKDKKKAVRAIWPGENEDVNTHVAKRRFPDLDTGTRITIGELPDSVSELINLIDPRLSGDTTMDIVGESPRRSGLNQRSVTLEIDGKPALLTRTREGDPCPESCAGQLHLQKGIEAGHTFHLHNRYSSPLKAQVLDSSNNNVDISMGCHGIGVSRIIGATSMLLSDAKGLNWPYVIAPFGAVIIAGQEVSLTDMSSIYDAVVHQNDQCELDAIIDDRGKAMGWKLKDADLVGYPFIIVMGRSWKEKKEVELQCRRLGVKETVPSQRLLEVIQSYVQQL